MQLELDVIAKAKWWGLPPELIQAVCVAEKDILKAIQCTYPGITQRDKALEIVCRSCAHAMSDFLVQHIGPGGWVVPLKQEFVEFWAKRWAPPGAANDPHNLNVNWPKNVYALWTGGADARDQPTKRA